MTEHREPTYVYSTNVMGLPAQAARNHQGKKAQKKMIQTSIVSRSPIFSESAIPACVDAGILVSR
jgi:hypothetical protein